MHTLIAPATTGLTHCCLPHAHPRKWHTPLRSPLLTYMSSWQAGEWRRWQRVAAAASAAEACSRTCRTSSTSKELPFACARVAVLAGVCPSRANVLRTAKVEHRWQLRPSTPSGKMLQTLHTGSNSTSH